MSGAAAAAAMAAAQRPAAFARAAPGLWEISGAPGAKSPIRECVADVAALARFEHRQLACKPSLLNEGESTSVVEYRCKAADFGRSTITTITPRSLRIETQGISGGLPFSYVIQARRIGECSGKLERGH